MRTKFNYKGYDLWMIYTNDSRSPEVRVEKDKALVTWANSLTEAKKAVDKLEGRPVWATAQAKAKKK